MNRVLSWKIASGVYAYIFKPDGKSYISNRISENSPIWKDTINTISEWNETEYKANFDLMKKEVSEKYGISLTYKPEYWEYSSGNENLTTNILVLAGKDGSGGGYGSGGDGIIGDGLGYEELADYINGKINAVKKDIEEQNEKVKDYIHDEVVDTIGDAKADIEQTKKDLDEIRTEFTEDLKGAKEALDKATELFGDGEINSEKIQSVFSTVDEHKEWFDEYSGNVASLVFDYDEVLQEMGGISVASAASKGLFSMFAESLNAISGTVGDVERTMDASKGKIEDIATWYDTSAATVTEASRLILASAAIISDTVKYMEESGITAEVQRQINGATASIIDTVKSETTSGITYIEQTLNGLSGIVATELTNLEATTSAITSIGNRFNATDATISEWMTKTDSAMSITNDLREHWSIESGKLSTVANLTAETDANGNIIYYVSGTTGDETVVYKTDDGKWTDGTHIYAESQVYVHFSKTIASYIQQQTSSVTISVMNDNITAAIKVAIKEDADGEKAIINMVADEVVITGEMIADAIKANQANIGGIWMGQGIIESQAQSANGNPMFRLDGNNGTLYAQNAIIDGEIRATSLTLGPIYGNMDIANFVDGKVDDSKDELETHMQGYLNGIVSSPNFKNDILSGYVTEATVDEWIKELDSKIPEGLSWEAISAISKQMIGAEISISEEPQRDEYGRVIYTANIGGVPYKWTTVEGDNFLLLEHTYSADGKSESFLVSKDGLLTAKNAWVQGKIYASEGYFQGEVQAEKGTFRGSVSADSGYFCGSVSADSGYFKGNIIANSLQLGSSYGNKDISQYISGYVTDNINFPVTDLGNCVKFDVKNGDGTKSFTFSKDGLLTANNAVIQGRILASSGYIGNIEISNGALSGANFTMSKTGLTMTGSLTQPYTAIDLSKSNFFETPIGRESGNFFFSANTKTITLPSLECNKTQIGRRITITNNVGSTVSANDFSLAKMSLPNGYYFFEDGRKTTSLNICNEVVDLIGFGNTSGNEFYGWSVLSRMNFMTKNSYGHTLQTLCNGMVNMGNGQITRFGSSDGTVYLEKRHCDSSTQSRNWNGNTFQYISTSSSVETNGIYSIFVRLPDIWFDRFNSNIDGLTYEENPDLFVQLTSYGKTPANVSYYGTTSSGFTIYSTSIDPVSFTIYNRGGWRSLSKREFFDFIVDSETVLEWYFNLGTDDAINDIKEITIISTVEGVNVRVEVPQENNQSFEYKIEKFYNYNFGITNFIVKVWPTDYDTINLAESTMKITGSYKGEDKSYNIKLKTKPQ
jgi:hypothetical protein